MSDEIKEILENIKNKYKDYYVQDIVSGEELKIILDYITNLQEENKMLKRDIKSLQNHYNEMFNMCNLRIDKAIEYIKLGKTFENKETAKIVQMLQNDLLNILTGGDKERKKDGSL